MISHKTHLGGCEIRLGTSCCACCMVSETSKTAFWKVKHVWALFLDLNSKNETRIILHNSIFIAQQSGKNWEWCKHYSLILSSSIPIMVLDSKQRNQNKFENIKFPFYLYYLIKAKPRKSNTDGLSLVLFCDIVVFWGSSTFNGLLQCLGWCGPPSPPHSVPTQKSNRQSFHFAQADPLLPI